MAFAFALSSVAHAGLAEWEALMRRGLADQERGDQQAATASFSAALKQAQALPDSDSRLALTLNILGSHHLAQGDFAAAEPLLKRALALRKKLLGSGHTDVARSLNNLAMLYAVQGRHEEAEPLLRESVAIWEKRPAAEHPDLAVSLNNLAMVCTAQGKYPQAEEALKRSLSIWERIGDARNLATVARNLSGVYEKMGRSGEARQIAGRAATPQAPQSERQVAQDAARSVQIVLPR